MFLPADRELNEKLLINNSSVKYFTFYALLNCSNGVNK